MRTLVQPLKAHTGCKHKLSRGLGKLRHGNLWYELQKPVPGRFNPFAPPPEVPIEVHMGSAIFHQAAQWLMSLPDHTRHPLHITDEEYASFVGGADA